MNRFLLWIGACNALVACERAAPVAAPVDASSDAPMDVAPDAPADAAPDAPAATGVYERAVASRRVRVTVYDPAIVRVQYHRERPHPDRGWTALPLPAPTAPLAATTEGDEDVVRTGSLTLRIHRATGNVTALDAAGRTLSRDITPASSAYPTELVRALDAGERVTALGEKTGRLDRRGRRLTMWNSDVWAVAGGSFPPTPTRCTSRSRSSSPCAAPRRWAPTSTTPSAPPSTSAAPLPTSSASPWRAATSATGSSPAPPSARWSSATPA